MSPPHPIPPSARSAWHALEPLHAVCYFHPLPTETLKALGLRGWWMSYFAGRFAPAGPIGAEPAAAMAFGFSKTMVGRSLPDAWAFASPEQVLVARIESAAEALRETLPEVEAVDVDRLGGLLEDVATGCSFGGRPLAAAWAAVAKGKRDWERVWVWATVLREHRGDGHVIAAAAHHLTGLQNTLTHIAVGGVTREAIQKNRGWTDEEWLEAESSLVERGVLDGGALTAEGTRLRQEVEDLTDRLAAPPFTEAQRATGEIVALAAPLSRLVVDRGVVPVPNPMGAPRP